MRHASATDRKCSGSDSFFKEMENRPNIDRGNGLSSFTKVTRVIPKYFKCFMLWYDMHLPLKTKKERRRRAKKKEEES